MFNSDYTSIRNGKVGMKLNKKLDWFPHIDEKIKVAKKKLMQLHTAIGKYWGPKPSLMLWAYKQVVQWCAYQNQQALFFEVNDLTLT